MGAQQTSFDRRHGDNRVEESRVYLTDIAIERSNISTPSIGEGHPKLAALCVFGPEGLEESGKIFPASEVASNQWAINSFIEIPAGVDAIYCSMQSEGGEDIGFVYLDGLRQSGHQMPTGQTTKAIQVFDTAGPLCMSWVMIEVPTEGAVRQRGAMDPLGLLSQARSLYFQFQRTQSVADISEAIAIQQRAVCSMAGGSKAFLRALGNLGSFLNARYKCTGDLNDISAAITGQTRAIQLCPEGHVDLPGHLKNLGNSFLRRFEHTGDLQDVAQAISSQARAVSLTPEGHADLPSLLNNLGNSFACRFECTGDLQDVAQAISSHARAVSLTPDGHADLPSHLNNLGNSFAGRFERTGDLQDVMQAISSHERAVSLTPEGHADLPSHLNNLGTSFLCRFERTGDLQDVVQAISSQARAVSLTPEGHADLPSLLNNLGSSFLGRFERTGDLQDVAQATLSQARAVSLTPKFHADLPSHLHNLGNSHLRYYDSDGPSEHLDKSISSHQLAATCGFGSPRIRISSASQWATLLDQHKPNTLEVITAFDTAICILALTAGLEQTVQHRHTIIQERAGLPLHAATTAFRLERLDKALEWLEHGRCLVWGQLSHFRAPLDELEANDADLARRFKVTSMQLESTGSSPRTRNSGMDIAETMSLEGQAHTHLQLAREWEDLLNTVREIPGFESFLRPSTCATLLRCLPASGAVVVINVHACRCDAIALLAGLDEPLHIPLPQFSLDMATNYQKQLNEELQSFRLRQRGDADTGTREGDTTPARTLERRGYHQPVTRDRVKMILEGLWKKVVKPILDGLAVLRANSGQPSAQLPRVWWCPTGPLSFLPLHAAGMYGGPEMESVMDYVVSSYTPTVTALSQRVKDECPIDESVSGLLLTCQPNVPHACPIPGTIKEVTSIHNQATTHGVNSMMFEGDALTPVECLELMEQFSSIHLACHASQNVAEPLSSRFRFHNGDLTLTEVMRANLKHADLAFLSACETGTGEEKLSDEAVHLAAGMLAAGYRRVIATMWSIDDTHATRVANDFYQYLWDHREEGSGAHFDGSLSAYALHHATQQLRGRLGDSTSSLLAWIPFVHFGY